MAFSFCNKILCSFQDRDLLPLCRPNCDPARKPCRFSCWKPSSHPSCGVIASISFTETRGSLTLSCSSSHGRDDEDPRKMRRRRGRPSWSDHTNMTGFTCSSFCSPPPTSSSSSFAVDDGGDDLHGHSLLPFPFASSSSSSSSSSVLQASPSSSSLSSFFQESSSSSTSMQTSSSSSSSSSSSMAPLSLSSPSPTPIPLSISSSSESPSSSSSSDSEKEPNLASSWTSSSGSVNEPSVSDSSKKYLSPESDCCRDPSRGVPVFVMLPLDSVSINNKVTKRRAMNASLLALKTAGVKGVMVNVWWGIVEKGGPQKYDWDGYKDLIDMVKQFGLKVQALMSFHQCPSNEDSCFIPLPPWVVAEIDANQDLLYTDRKGRRNYECLSLGCDMHPVLKNRSPIQVYTDYMRSFRDNFRDLLGNIIVEIQVGMGPGGELRYPSYQGANEVRRLPGIGEFQCYDKYMLASLKAATVNASMAEQGNVARFSEAASRLRGEVEGLRSDAPLERGDLFLQWYSGMLEKHGERVLGAARAIFREQSGVKISGKLGCVHWQYRTHSHPAELAAGYYNAGARNGYLPLARMFARQGAVLTLTGLEMRDMEQPAEAMCSPEQLIRQMVACAQQAGALVSGENALPRFDRAALEQVIKNSFHDDDSHHHRPRHHPHRYHHHHHHRHHHQPLSSFTFRRMGPALFQKDNWHNFVPFVRQMGEGQSSRRRWDERESFSSAAVHASSVIAYHGSSSSLRDHPGKDLLCLL